MVPRSIRVHFRMYPPPSLNDVGFRQNFLVTHTSCASLSCSGVSLRFLGSSTPPVPSSCLVFFQEIYHNVKQTRRINRSVRQSISDTVIVLIRVITLTHKNSNLPHRLTPFDIASLTTFKQVEIIPRSFQTRSISSIWSINQYNILNYFSWIPFLCLIITYWKYN